MRTLPLVLALLPTLAHAQLGAPPQAATGMPASSWSLGVQSFGPTLTGHAQGIQSGQPIFVDLDADLGLARTKTTPGFFLDYQGPRFAFQVASGSAEYRGDRVVTRTVTVDGTSFTSGTRVQSHVKLAALDGIWTVKLVSQPEGWLGLDLGAQVWSLDLDAVGTPAAPAPAQSGSASLKAPIPQVGLSAGGRLLNGALEGKAHYRLLAYRKAKYTHTGAEVRVFPVRWLGVRAFVESSSFDVPKGSLQDDLELQLDRKGSGFGVVLRF